MDNGRRKVRPAETYVLDDNVVEELDDASLTSILREVSEDPERDTSDPNPSNQGANEHSGNDHSGKDYRDPEIDELLHPDKDSAEPEDQDFETTGTFAEEEVMISPDMLFPAEDGLDES